MLRSSKAGKFGGIQVITGEEKNQRHALLGKGEEKSKGGSKVFNLGGK